ncbi:MAG: AAA family ATPase [Bacteroidia bacterium]|nr:AAA family ATPase [Bacteroidia bacterium]
MEQETRIQLESILGISEALQKEMQHYLLIGGHVPIEGQPSVAKMMITSPLSTMVSVYFSRIQFAPGFLTPSDVVGTSVFNLKTSEFEFRRGPILGQFVLIDEINKVPAKTQCALVNIEVHYPILSEKIEVLYLMYCIPVTLNKEKRNGKLYISQSGSRLNPSN